MALSYIKPRREGRVDVILCDRVGNTMSVIAF